MVYKIFSNASKQTVVYLFSILLALLVFMGIAVVYAWAEPTQAPPSGNVSAPVNVGATTQYKSGALGVEGLFRAYSTAVIEGPAPGYGANLRVKGDILLGDTVTDTNAIFFGNNYNYIAGTYIRQISQNELGIFTAGAAVLIFDQGN